MLQRKETRKAAFKSRMGIDITTGVSADEGRVKGTCSTGHVDISPSERFCMSHQQDIELLEHKSFVMQSV